MRLLAFVVALVGATNDPSSIPNIDQVGRGIDLFKSDPDALTQDPGLKLKIFTVDCATCYQKGHTFNMQYKIPDGLSVRPAPSCSYNAETTEIHDTFDFQESLTYSHTKTKWGLFSGRHTWSESFQYVAKMTGNMEYVMVKAKASCSSYMAQLDAYEVGINNMNPGFISSVRALPVTLDDSTKAAYAQFVDNFGTHYFNRVVMGASATMQFWFKQVDYTSLKQQNYDVKTAAALAFLEKFGAGDWIKNHKSYRDYTEFHSKIYSAPEPHWVPEQPPMGPNISIESSAWAEQVQLPRANAGIIAYDAVLLSELLTSKFFNNTDDHIYEKAKNLNTYISVMYCRAVQCVNATQNPKWEKVNAPLIVPRGGHGVASVKNDRFLLGGLPFNPRISLKANTNRGEKWEYTAPPQQQMVYPAVTVLDSKVYVIGGQDSAGHPSDFVAHFDTVKSMWVMQTKLKYPRQWLAAATVGNNIFALGGYNGGVTNYNEVYFPETQEWRAKTPMPVSLHSHSAVVVNTWIYVIGGNPAGATALRYDTAHDVWETIEPIPAANRPRYGHSSVVIGNLIYVMGGVTTDGSNTVLDDVAVYDLSKHSWGVAPPMYGKRYYGSAIVSRIQTGDIFNSTSTQIRWTGGFAALPVGSQPSDLEMVYTIPDPLSLLAQQSQYQSRLSMPTSTEEKITPKHKAEEEEETQADNQATLPVFPAIDFLSYGYDILRGNPLGESMDEGWVAQGAYDIACPKCFSKGKHFQKLWSLPDGVSVHKLESCSYHADTFVVKDAVELQAMLDASAKIKIDAGIPLLLGFQFSASLGVQAMTKLLADRSSSLVIATAKCEAYRVSIDHHNFNGQMWDNFLLGLQSLPARFTPVNPQPWLEFVQAFGTHVPVEMVLGGKATMINYIKTAQYSELLTANLDVHESARGSFLIFWGAKEKVTGSFNFRQSDIFSQKTTLNWTKCAPRCPPHVEGALTESNDWANSVLLPNGNPVPISVTLSPITSVIPAAIQKQYKAQIDGLIQFLNTPSSNASYCALVEGCQNPSAQQGWTRQLAEIPTPRGLFASGLIGNTLLVAGGTDGKTQFDTVHALDLGASPLVWKTAMRMNYVRGAPGSAVVAGKYFHVFGGFKGNNFVTFHERFDMETHSWVAAAPIPIASAYQAAIGIDSQIISIGGLNGSTVLDTAMIYNLKTDTWQVVSPRMPNGPRYGGALARVGSKQLYYCGGLTTGGAPVADIVLFNLDSLTWNPVQVSLPLPRYYASVVSLPGFNNFILLGGTEVPLSGGAAPSSNVLMFDANFAGFTQLSPMTTAATAHGAVFHDGNLHLVGGISPAGSPISVVYSMDHANSTLSVPAKTLAVRPQPQPQRELIRKDLPEEFPFKDASQRSGDYAVFPLVHYMGRGYNRVKGEPLVSDRDEGWAPSPILDAGCDSCFSQGKLLDGVYAVPDALEVTKVSQCAYAQDTFQIHDAKSLQTIMSKAYNFKVRVGLPILVGLEFTASKTFREVTEKTMSLSAMLVLGYGRCTNYQVALDTTAKLPFTDDFLQAIAALPGNLDPNNLAPWLDFVESFGTHIPISLLTGSEILQSSVFTSANFSAFLQANLDIKAAGRASLLVFFGALRGSVDVDAQIYATFSAKFNTNRTFCKPVCPPVGPDVNTRTDGWRANLQNRAVPIGGDMISVPELIQDRIAEGLVHSSLVPTLSAASKNLATFMNTYYCAMTGACSPAASLPRPVPSSATMQTPRVNTASVSTGSMVLVMGGSKDAGGTSPLNVVEGFDVNKQTWQTLQSLSAARAFATSTVVGNVVYVVGGLNGSTTYLTSCESMDLAQFVWQRCGDLTTGGRADATSVTLNGQLYVIGGRSGPITGTSSTIARNNTEVFDPKTQQWKALASPLNQPRFGATAVVVGGVIYLFGGETGVQNVLTDSVEALVGGVWKMVIPLPSPRSRMTVIPYPGTTTNVLLVGGILGNRDGGSSGSTSSVISCDMSSGFCRDERALLRARHGASSTLLNTVSSTSLSLTADTSPALLLLGGLSGGTITVDSEVISL